MKAARDLINSRMKQQSAQSALRFESNSSVNAYAIAASFAVAQDDFDPREILFLMVSYSYRLNLRNTTILVLVLIVENIEILKTKTSEYQTRISD